MINFPNIKMTAAQSSVSNTPILNRSLPVQNPLPQKDVNKKNNNIKIITAIAVGLILLAGGFKGIKALMKRKAILKPQNPEKNVISEIDKFVENFISKVKPKDETTAREALPEIIKQSEKLKIKDDIEATELFLNQITPKNKEFLLCRGISILAENMNKIETKVKDPEKSYKILGFLSQDNEKLLPKLLDNSEKLKIGKVSHINSYLVSLNDKKFNFAFFDVLPSLQKYENVLKIKNSTQIADIMEHINPETSNVIELVAKNAEKFNIDDYSELILSINAENKSNASFIFENWKKLGIEKAEDCENFKNLLNKEYGELLKIIENK